MGSAAFQIDRNARARIKALIAAEISSADIHPPNSWHAQTVADFQEALIDPVPLNVHFAGGHNMDCWQVTRSNGSYRVIYIPSVDYFSLAVESRFGPVDINVHGPAIGCFASVG